MIHRLSTVSTEALCQRCGSPDHNLNFCPISYEGFHRCRRHNKRHTPFVPSFESWVDFPIVCLECFGVPPLPTRLIQKGIAAAKLGVFTSVQCALSMPTSHPLGPGTGHYVEIHKGDRRRLYSGSRSRYSETKISWPCPHGDCLAINEFYVPDDTLPERKLWDADARTSVYGNMRLGPLLAPEPSRFKQRKRFAKAIECARLWSIGCADLCPLLAAVALPEGPWLVLPTGQPH